MTRKVDEHPKTESSERTRRTQSCPMDLLAKTERTSLRQEVAKEVSTEEETTKAPQKATLQPRMIREKNEVVVWALDPEEEDEEAVLVVEEGDLVVLEEVVENESLKEEVVAIDREYQNSLSIMLHLKSMTMPYSSSKSVLIPKTVQSSLKCNSSNDNISNL